MAKTEIKFLSSLVLILVLFQSIYGIHLPNAHSGYWMNGPTGSIVSSTSTKEPIIEPIEEPTPTPTTTPTTTPTPTPTTTPTPTPTPVPYVPPNQPPVAVINAPSEEWKKVEVTFDGSGSYDPDGVITSYTWSGAVSGTGMKIKKTFPSKGNYSITLTVQDNDGTKRSTVHTITIKNHKPTKPIVKAYPQKGPAPMFVDLSSETTDQDNDEITKWQWDYGNGTPIETHLCSEECSKYEIEDKMFAISGTFNIQARAFDGEEWSEWSDPVVTVIKTVGIIRIGAKKIKTGEKTEITTACTEPGIELKVYIKNSDGDIIYRYENDPAFSGNTVLCGTKSAPNSFTPSIEFNEAGAYQAIAEIADSTTCSKCKETAVIKVMAKMKEIENPEIHPLLAIALIVGVFAIIKSKAKKS